MPDLEDLLLQAAGRMGKNNSQPRPSNQRWQQQRGRRGGSYSGGSGSDDDDDSDAAPTYSNSRKNPPSGLQVPLKKRHQPKKSGSRGGWQEDDDEDFDEGRQSGDYSDSVSSVESDPYKDEDDKEQLEKMSEMDRGVILAERSTTIDDYKLKQLARASIGLGGHWARWAKLWAT